MAEVKPCDVIAVPGISDSLLVVETDLKVIQAGTIAHRDSQEIVTIPGTYLPEHLGAIAVIDSWDIGRAAEALARGLFGGNNRLYDRYVTIWRQSLVHAKMSNPPFNPSA